MSVIKPTRSKLLFFLLSIVLLNVQKVSAQSKLEISGDVTTPLSLTTQDLKAYKIHNYTATDRDQRQNEFKGVSLMDILKKAGVPSGKELRGENILKIVLVTASDGYRAVFSLTEVDPEISGKEVLIVFEKNGAPLPQGEGPFRLIATGDSKMPRWVREVSSIKIVYPKE